MLFLGKLKKTGHSGFILKKERNVIIWRFLEMILFDFKAHMCKRKDIWYNRLPWYFHVFPHTSGRIYIYLSAVCTLPVMVKGLGRESPEAMSDMQEFLVPCLLPTSAPSLSIITVNIFVKLGIFQVRGFPEADCSFHFSLLRVVLSLPTVDWVSISTDKLHSGTYF